MNENALLSQKFDIRHFFSIQCETVVTGCLQPSRHPTAKEAMMKYKLPVVLAMVVASQCAPLVTEVKGEDIEFGKTDEAAVLTSISANPLFNQNGGNDYLEMLLASETAYLNTDTNLLVSKDVPAASSGVSAKREKVFILETDGDNSFVVSEKGKTGWVPTARLSISLSWIFDDVSETMYVKENSVQVYASPDEGSSILTTLSQNDAVSVTGISTEAFSRITINDKDGYILSDKLQDHAVTFADQLTSIQSAAVTYSWGGAVLNRSAGSVIGPSGKETYYNLDMSTVISVMRSLGFDAADYPYWIRSDGAKMLGPYIMIAADLSAHPKGTTMEISLGTGLVCDTGGFVSNGSGTKVDVATAW